MTLSRRLALLVITLLPVLILLISGGIYLKRQMDRLLGQAHVVIADELQRRFGKEVRIGSVDISRKVIALHDVKISKEATFATGTLISVPKLLVYYDLRGLILGGRGAGAVTEVVVTRPRAFLVRHPDGTFNIIELLKPPPGPERPPFLGRLKITGGEVEFVDYAVVPGQRHGPVAIRDISGSLDAAGYPVYAFKGTATGRGQFASAEFSGKYYATTRHRIVVDARALGVSATTAMPYAWKSNDVEVLGGKLDLDAVVDARQVDGRYSTAVTGRVRVRDAAVGSKFLRAPASGLNGELVLVPDRVNADLTGSLRGSPMHVTGTFSNFARPLLNLTVTSSSADFAGIISATTFLEALSQFSLSGRGPAVARITGLLSDPVVDVTAKVPRAVVRDIPVSNVAISARYRSGRVDISSLRLSAKGAGVAASGYVTTGRSPAVSLSGRFSGLQLRALPVDVSMPLTGVASGAFSLTGPTSSPAVSVSLRAAKGSVSDVPFESADARIRLAGSRLVLSSLRVDGVAGGSLRAHGTVTPTSIDVIASALSIDVASVAERLGETGYSGTAFFSGRIFGSAKAPQVDGSIEVFDAQVNGYAIDYALVGFSGNRHSAIINEGLVQMFPAEARFTGELTGLDQNRTSFSGKGNVQRLEVAKLLDILDRRAKVSGTILGDVTFSGVFLPHARRGTPRVIGVVASGNLSLEDAFAFDYPISSASAKLDYSNNLLRVSDASVTSDKAALGLSGTLATDTYEISAGFDLTGFDLSRLHEYLGDYLVLAGTSSASGTVSGTWDDLQSAVSAKVDGLAVNYERFDSAEAKVTYADGKYASYSASLVRGTQKLELSGTGFDADAMCLTSATGSVEDVSVPDIWAILRASPYFSTPNGKSAAKALDKFPKVVSGRVNGSFDISGCLDAPDGSVNLSATNIGLDVEKFDSIDLQATSKAGVVSIGKMQAVSADMTVDVAGAPAYDNGNLDLEIRAENFRLSRLQPWLGANAPGGTLSALFLIQGPVSAPDIRGSAEVVKPSFGTLVLDQMRAGSIEVTASRIEIPDILLTAAGYQASASASVPWSWTALAIPDDEPIGLSIDLGSQNLGILNVLGPIVDTAKTTGDITEAWFNLDGTLLDPQLTGSVKVGNGSIAVPGFINTFSSVNVDLGFVGDRLVVNTLTAASSLGGSVYIVPGGYVTAGILAPSEVNLQVVADRLKVAERNALGMREDVNAQLDAGLSITGPLSAPLIADRKMGSVAGGITVSRARASFQMMSREALWQAKLPTNPTFNVSLRLGQDVVVAPPSMSLTVTGGGTLTGTLAEPAINRLALDVLSGDIGLATARLRIMPGGRIYITYAPPDPPDVQVDLRATTSVFAINTLRQRQRYQITMAITGQAANPQISLSSSPPGLSREQMLAGLGHLPSLFGSPETGLQQELGGVLTAAGAQALFAPIENLFIQKLGFEQFSLEFSPMFPLSIYASRHLFGNYYISFYRQLRGALASTQDVWYKVTLAYRTGVYEFHIGADDEQTLSAQIGYAKAFW